MQFYKQTNNEMYIAMTYFVFVYLNNGHNHYDDDLLLFSCNKCATGMPTILERPKTTQFLPDISTLERFSNSMQPAGVQDVANGEWPLNAK